MVKKYRNFVLLTLLVFLFPAFSEQTISNSNNARFDHYLNWERFRLLGNKDLSQNISKGLSLYGDIIRQESQKSGWDWRLITIVIYSESRFDPHAGSYTGASGLMQLMPGTARSFGLKNIYDPVQNIRGGIRFMSWLNEQFMKEIPDENERIKFVLASYNGGLNRLRKAQRLAAKHGKNPLIWNDNVDHYISGKPGKSNHPDSGLSSGYDRGKETFEFVQAILYHYDDFIAYIPM